MKGIAIIGLCCFVSVYSAPVEVKEETKRRETTRETLELENELKRLAGENKQYFTANGGQPMPQIDGLEDHPKHPSVPVRQPVEPASDVVDQDENSEEQQQLESQEEQENEDEQSQEAEEDQESNISNNNNEDESEENENHNPDNESEDNENNVGDKDIPSSDEMELDNEAAAAAGPQPIYYPEQGYGNNYVNYKGDYPYGGMGESDLQNEDFVVQDVLEMMEQHPQLWNRLIQAKNDLMKEEEEVAEEEESEQNNRDDNSNSKDDISNSEPQLDSIQQLSDSYYQQPESIYDREEEALQKMKALQQYEKYQQLYGDADAHVVAKKRGYGPGPASDNTAKDGSGETSENHHQKEDHRIPDKAQVANTVQEGKSSSEDKVTPM